MTEVKIIKLEQKFKGTEDLYRYLLKNVDAIEQATGMQIQKPLKERPICVTGKEKITERNIVFFASKSEYHESLGELLICAGAFDADVIVFFTPKTGKAHLEPLNWLHKICNDDTDFIVCEVSYSS